MKVVIPAAGLGTGFFPWSKAQPKEMLPLGRKPVLQYIVEDAVKAGFHDIVIVIGEHKQAIVDHFSPSTFFQENLREKGMNDLAERSIEISRIANFEFVNQPSPRGLGDAILCAENALGSEPFAVLLGDVVHISQIPILTQLMRGLSGLEASMIGVVKAEKTVLGRYGVVSLKNNEDGRLRIISMVEKPRENEAPSNLIASGCYILEPEIFDYLRALSPGIGGELQLTDALNKMCSDRIIFAKEIECRRYDVGHYEGWMEANSTLWERREETLSQSSVFSTIDSAK